MSRLFVNTCYQTLLKTNCTSKNITTCRSLHLKCRFRNTYLKPYLVPKFSRHTSVFGAVFARNASTEDTSAVQNLLDQIPDAPVPITVPEVLETIATVGEPSLKSLGLGGYTPVGLIQQCFEWLHIGCGIPWWGSIVIGTICVRVLLFPLVILAQRNSAKLNNHLPEMQLIQLKVSEARRMGNHFECAKHSEDLLKFFKKYDISILKNMIVPIAQAPVFCSFFMALRSMANAPVESMQHGGLWWFTDLTVCDPYYILPIITSVTLSVTIEVGTDSAKLQSMGMMRYMLRIIPLAIIPFTINFPGAILCYWVSTNFVSLIQVGILKIPKVRNYFNIEPMITFKPDDFPKVNKGFVKGFKESWSNLKVARDLRERERIDEMEFLRAGRGPIRKTFKINPLEEASSNNSIMAKRR